MAWPNVSSAAKRRYLELTCVARVGNKNDDDLNKPNTLATASRLRGWQDKL